MRTTNNSGQKVYTRKRKIKQKEKKYIKRSLSQYRASELVLIKNFLFFFGSHKIIMKRSQRSYYSSVSRIFNEFEGNFWASFENKIFKEDILWSVCFGKGLCGFLLLGWFIQEILFSEMSAEHFCFFTTAGYLFNFKQSIYELVEKFCFYFYTDKLGVSIYCVVGRFVIKGNVMTFSF